MGGTGGGGELQPEPEKNDGMGMVATNHESAQSRLSTGLDSSITIPFPPIHIQHCNSCIETLADASHSPEVVYN